MLFFRQRFAEEAHRPLLAEEFRPRAQRSIARDLIVFGGLSGRQNAGVPYGLVIDLVYHFLPFRDDAEDRIAGLAAGLFAHGLEYFLKPLHISFGFVAVSRQRLLQYAICALLGELVQAFE